MLIRHPNKIKSQTVIDEPVMSMDFLPTFINLADAKKTRDFKFDGIYIMAQISEGEFI